MAKKDCPPGTELDMLVNICMPSKTETRTEPPPTKSPLAVMVKATTPAIKADSVLVLSPALWILVVLATLGSILALALWFIIYKRQTRHRDTTENAEQQQEPLQKTEPPTKIYPLPSEINCQSEMLQRAAGAAPCPHLLQGAPTGSKWEEGFNAYRDPVKHAGTEGGRGLHTCSTMREHRIPLPATELGGTALVTTKTM